MEHNLTHMVASDAHNTTSRGFHLAESYELIEKEFGMNVMSDLKENPYLLISGKAIYKEDPEQIRRKNYSVFLNKELVMSLTVINGALGRAVGRNFISCLP